jgi:polysaccharide deacetylase 2 family uncharacterized protein YibQ
MSGAKTGDKVFRKAFLQGIGAVAVVYIGIFTFVALQADKTLHRLEEQFPFRVVAIVRPPPPDEAYVYPPTPAAPGTAQAEYQPAPTPGDQQAQIDVPMGPLKPAPFEGLYEVKDGLKLPKIDADGMTPFEAYKRPFGYLGNPVVALVIRNYGLSVADSDIALALPPEVTLLLSPYADNPELWQKKAREAGHEVWLNLPMENNRYLVDDPGPQALLSRASLPENQKKLNNVLGSVTGYTGIVAETDKAFLDMHAMLGELIKSVFARGLGYVEMNPAGSEFLETLAVASNTPFMAVDENGGIYNESDLGRLESLARQKGYVTATIALQPKNLEALKVWGLGLASRNITLAPLSAVAAGRVPKKSLPRPTTGEPPTAAPTE